jgi:hypothetical protein
MNRMIEDLRFCIGAFFLLVGVLLAGHGVIVGTLVAGFNLNLFTGIAFVLFGGLSLALSIRAVT